MYRIKPEVDPFQKKRRRIIIAVVLIIVIGVFSLFFFLKDDSEPLTINYPICDFTQEEIVNNFNDYKFDEIIRLKDYFFYGEALSMFEHDYDIFKKNSLLGKTFLLRNYCNGDEYYYLIDDNVDDQIPLNLLPAGFYEVFINVDMVKKRVVYSELLQDSLNTVRRFNVSKNIELVANKNIFDDAQNKNLLSEDYLFINVIDNEETIADYDIVLDPGLGINPSGFFDNYGASFLGMIEADELYDLALSTKEILEKAGLKVLISRDSKDDIINVYGKGGRLDKAYASKAKYFVELNFNNSEIGGLRVYKSSYVSNAFSNFVAKYLLDNTELNRYGNNSVISANRYQGLDGVISIREIGGKALSAATFSELAKSENGSFAYKNNKALEAISIELLSYLNEEELVYYQSNKTEIAQALAEALIEYFNLGASDDISD